VLSALFGVTKDTLDSYLTFLQDTYLISTIPPYFTNRDVEIRGAKKLYFIDSGLLNQFSRLDPGSIFENCIFNILCYHGEVKYWQQKDGQEIDFIVNEKMAYEAKLHAIDQNVKKLIRRANKINIKEQFVVSLKYSDTPKTTYGFLL
jgi:predicted AAA+ superfamily ATPase